MDCELCVHQFRPRIFRSLGPPLKPTPSTLDNIDATCKHTTLSPEPWSLVLQWALKILYDPKYLSGVIEKVTSCRISGIKGTNPRNPYLRSHFFVTPEGVGLPSLAHLAYWLIFSESYRDNEKDHGSYYVGFRV